MSDVEARRAEAIDLQPTLSICIATYNRGRFIGETLDSILPQLSSDVEIVVVDGASLDNTFQVVSEYIVRHPSIRYIRENENSGVDRDYDKAVGYARGLYCWLMTDDDILCDGAVKRVLIEISNSIDLVVVNSEVRSVDLSLSLLKNILPLNGAVKYNENSFEDFFCDTGSYLSFIGGVVIRRALWEARRRTDYYGSLFIHVGVIFQEPIRSAVVIRDPLIVIRYGNAMWTPRGFEIWMFKWPGLIWSFPHFSGQAKERITSLAPWRRVRTLFLYRAKGSYTRNEYVRYLRNESAGLFSRLLFWGVAVLPAGFVNLVMVLKARIVGASDGMLLVDLINAKSATWLARRIARGLR